MNRNINSYKLLDCFYFVNFCRNNTKSCRHSEKYFRITDRELENIQHVQIVTIHRP